MPRARGRMRRARQRGARGAGHASAAVRPPTTPLMPHLARGAPPGALGRRGAAARPAAGRRPGWRSRRCRRPSSRAAYRQGRPEPAPGAACRGRHWCARCWCATASTCAQGEPLLVLGDVSVDADLNRLDYRVDGRTRQPGAARGRAGLGARRCAFRRDVVAAAQPIRALAEQMAKERALFEARRDALVGQSALLRAQQAKVAQEIGALRAQIAQASESMKYQRAELETNRRLLKDGFISATRIAQLEAHGRRLRRQARGAALRTGARRAAHGRCRPAHPRRSKATTGSRRATSSR